MIRKTATTLLAATLLLVLATGPAPAQEEPQAMKDAVKSLRDDYFAAYGAGEPGTAAGLFKSDGVLLPPAAPSIRGPEQIRERLGSFFENQTVSLGAISEETLVVGDRVVDRGILTVEVTPAGSDESSTDTGKYVLLAEKTGSGEDGESAWKIRWLMWNTDHPMRASGGGQEED